MMPKSDDTKTTGSYRDVLRVSMPIVISMTTTVVMTFTDRVFLANYSIDAIAAALPAGIIAYVFVGKKRSKRFEEYRYIPFMDDDDADKKN